MTARTPMERLCAEARTLAFARRRVGPERLARLERLAREARASTDHSAAQAVVDAAFAFVAARGTGDADALERIAARYMRLRAGQPGRGTADAQAYWWQRGTMA